MLLDNIELRIENKKIKFSKKKCLAIVAIDLLKNG